MLQMKPQRIQLSVRVLILKKRKEKDKKLAIRCDPNIYKVEGTDGRRS